MPSVAKAPGKVVLSGAYSVLEGAPAVVAAVDRYVSADASIPPERITDEVQQAIDLDIISGACGFDATALRTVDPHGADRKLGLGSSAAILAATYFAMTDQPQTSAWGPLVLAHRRAQAGGSGIDVAASVWGGVIACQPDPDVPGGLTITRTKLPTDLHFTFFYSPTAASTRTMRAAVDAFKVHDETHYARLISQARLGADAFVRAVEGSDAVKALAIQFEALTALGDESGADIVPSSQRAVAARAAACGQAFGPSGAGGGDISFYCGTTPIDAVLQRLAFDAGLVPLSLTLGAPGAHQLSTP